MLFQDLKIVLTEMLPCFLEKVCRKGEKQTQRVEDQFRTRNLGQTDGTSPIPLR